MTYRFSKNASVKETLSEAAKRVAKWVKNNPHQIAGAGIGGALSALGTYLVSRPGKSGRSIDQGESSKLKRPKKDETFAQGLARIFHNTRTEMADLAAKHPVSMALASAPTGAVLGRTIAEKLKTGSAMYKLASPEIIDLVEEWGRERARRETNTLIKLYEATEKLAFGQDLGHAIGSIGRHIVRTPSAKRALIGAGIGAAKHYLVGDNKGTASLLGDMALGAGAGLGAPHAVGMLSRMKGEGFKGAIGEGVRQGLAGK
jgi:hypothetical protein